MQQDHYDDLPLNHRFSAFKILGQKNYLPEFPVHVQMDLVGACNNKCPFCFFRDGADNIGEERDPIRKKTLDTQIALRLLDEFHTNGVKAITITGGGESLIHKDINLILKKIIDHKFELGIMSNLNILPDVTLMRQVKWLRVSLDAASKEVYQKVHAPGGGITFDTVVDNMKKLAGHIDLGISFLVYKENWHEIAEAAKLAADIGADYIQYKLVFDTDHSTDLIPQREKIFELVAQAKEIGAKSKKLEVIDLLGRVSLIEKSPRNYRQCYIHRHTAIVGVEAELYLCCLLKYVDTFSMGSLKNSTFKELWLGEKRRQVLESFDKEKCPTCFYEKTNETIDYLLSQDNPHKNFI